MTRFTKYTPDPRALRISPHRPSLARARFTGWDEAHKGARATEATHETGIGLKMSPVDVARFNALNPGAEAVHGGHVYRREF